jgi:hypothetical protein
MPIIDQEVEEPARQMLGHAIRGELAELAAAIRAGGSERYRQVLGLFLVTAAYIAVDVSGRCPPTPTCGRSPGRWQSTRTARRSPRSTFTSTCQARHWASGLPSARLATTRRRPWGPCLGHRRHAVHIPPERRQVVGLPRPDREGLRSRRDHRPVGTACASGARPHAGRSRVCRRRARLTAPVAAGGAYCHGGNYVLSNVVQQGNAEGMRMAVFPSAAEWGAPGPPIGAA